jgi:hypothetical protein
LSREVVASLAGEPDKKNLHEQNPASSLEKLKSQIVHLNLVEAADRVGAGFSGKKLTLLIPG